jgi:hypothetical protein
VIPLATRIANAFGLPMKIVALLKLDFGHFVLRNTQGIPWIFSNDKKLNQLRLRKQKK